MGRLRWLAILMIVVILAITGFQVYWLKDTYNRERKTVELRVQSLFKETVREQQDAVLQLKLQQVFKNSPAKPTAVRTQMFEETTFPGRCRPCSKSYRYAQTKNKERLPARNRVLPGSKLRVIFDSINPHQAEGMLVVRDRPCRKRGLIINDKRAG